MWCALQGKCISVGVEAPFAQLNWCDCAVQGVAWCLGEWQRHISLQKCKALSQREFVMVEWVMGRYDERRRTKGLLHVSSCSSSHLHPHMGPLLEVHWTTSAIQSNWNTVFGNTFSLYLASSMSNILCHILLSYMQIWEENLTLSHGLHYKLMSV